MRHSVEFASDGITLRGWLFVPETSSQPSPAIVMIHGFSATTVMVLDHYANAFAEIGVTALLVDTRSFGFSDGDPRSQINVWGEARDYLAALDYLETLDLVDSRRMAIWGDSLSSAVGAVVAAIDDRVSAAILQVPGLGDEVKTPDPDSRRFEQIKSTVLHGDLDSLDRRVIGPLPVVAEQEGTPCFLETHSAFEWFTTFGSRPGTGWRNEATVLRLDTPVSFSPQVCVPHVGAPLLMVVADGDEMPGCDADVSRHLLTTAAGQTDLLQIEGGHFGPLYPGTHDFKLAIKHEQGFLTKHLFG